MVVACEAEHQRDRWMTSTLCVQRTPDVSNIRYRSNRSYHLESKEYQKLEKISFHRIFERRRKLTI